MKSLAYFILFFGIFVLGGGVYGFIKVQSIPSLIMGSGFGIALILSSIGIFEGNRKILIVAFVLSIALAGFFISRLVRNPVVFPAGIMSILSLIGVVLTGAKVFCKKCSTTLRE